MLALKQIKINTNKEKFEENVTSTYNTITNNIDNINNIISSHKEFLLFIEMMQVFEIYRWTTLKSEYNTIKKQFNMNKKLYRNVSELYGDVITYYNEENITKYNNMLKNIGSVNNTMLYTFIELKKLHKDVYKRFQQFIKNDNIIKIHEINDTNKEIIKELYQNYIDSKFINKMLANIKTKKFLYESQSIK